MALRVIKTKKELRALPSPTRGGTNVLIGYNDRVYVRWLVSWFEAGSDEILRPKDIDLPVTVLWPVSDD